VEVAGSEGLHPGLNGTSVFRKLFFRSMLRRFVVREPLVVGTNSIAFIAFFLSRMLGAASSHPSFSRRGALLPRPAGEAFPLPWGCFARASLYSPWNACLDQSSWTPWSNSVRNSARGLFNSLGAVPK
jgi:hypothetical protein